MGPVMKWLVISVLGLVVVVLSIVLALVWSMPDLPTTIKHDTVCLPNEQGKLICGKTPRILHDYLMRVISNEYERIKQEDEERQQKYLDENRVRLMAIYDKYYWEMKPAAKVTGKELPDLREADVGQEMTPIRVWRHGRELYDTSGFLRYGIRYRNGRLVVPVSGTYFIYSFVDFFEPCSPTTGKPNISDANKPIKHGVYKFNILSELETEIVSNLQPHTVSGNRYFNSYSSYVSSLADLKAGDEISVKVSNLTYLKYTRDNYFGLNLI
ncbi:uncharacterized protein LOC128545995 [Mercenaria mercenaria]|uniref:uncharacterized protein LOC128545995 n=1 Tax=Mercenaria mercenaria TaxID=6596 RepID=UPI00234F7D2D|nr:uncharacterized protein LOC128545995 [Mercenaria mercenaria]